MTSAEYNAELNLARTTGSILFMRMRMGLRLMMQLEERLIVIPSPYIHGKSGKDAVINIDKDANLQLFLV